MKVNSCCCCFDLKTAVNFLGGLFVCEMFVLLLNDNYTGLDYVIFAVKLIFWLLCVCRDTPENRSYFFKIYALTVSVQVSRAVTFAIEDREEYARLMCANKDKVIEYGFISREECHEYIDDDVDLLDALSIA